MLSCASLSLVRCPAIFCLRFVLFFSLFFFFNDTATTEIYTLSLHDALPIQALANAGLHTHERDEERIGVAVGAGIGGIADRKSTRLNSSHLVISYAVFC